MVKKSTVKKESLSLLASDGYKINGTLFTCGSTDKSAVVIINSATGVIQEYYSSFARYIAGHGFVVITYDYRGIGKSLYQDVSDFKGEMRDWGELDMVGVIDQVSDAYPGCDILCIGHSVGGQLPGLACNNDKIKAIISVAGQVGYWRLWSGRYKFKSWLMFFILIPLLTRMRGYFPGSRFGMVDMPSRIARQWAEWCRNRNYLVDGAGVPIRECFRSFNGRIMFYSFYDDEQFAPINAVKALMGYYSNSHVEHRHINKAMTDGKAIGHFGFFRATYKKTLWSDVLLWLDSVRS